MIISFVNLALFSFEKGLGNIVNVTNLLNVQADFKTLKKRNLPSELPEEIEDNTMVKTVDSYLEKSKGGHSPPLPWSIQGIYPTRKI